jgi:S-adenosylmethionine hydrolase
MLITFTTDFGLADSFVGIMKGVIYGIDPSAHVLDLTHGIPPHNILAGALTLRHAVPYFPAGTAHLAVIDPGVGGSRAPLLIEADGSYFIGPDNGVFSLALQGRRVDQIVRLSNSAYQLRPQSLTFQGRDIFAPAAGYLSRGVPPVAFGERLDALIKLELPAAVRERDCLRGEIIHIDRFGNLFTNIEVGDLRALPEGRLVIELSGLRIHGLAPSYAAVPAGDFVAVINSWGVLEIAVNCGAAAQRTEAALGAKVSVFAAPGGGQSE